MNRFRRLTLLLFIAFTCSISALAQEDRKERLEFLRTGYQNGELSRKESMEFAVLLADSSPPESALLGAKYIDTFTESEILDPANLEFMSLFGSNTEGPVFTFIRSHRDQFVAKHGEDGLNMVLGSFYNFNLADAVDHQNEAKLVTVLDIILPIYINVPSELPSARFVTRKMYLANTEDWKGYAALVDNYYSENGHNENEFWYGEAYEAINEYYDTSEALNLAFNWLEKALLETEDFETYYLYSYALALDEKYELAVEKATKAKPLALSDEHNQAYDELIAYIDENKGGN